MMLMVRLHPKYELKKVWEFIKAEFEEYQSKDIP
jgi:hypothetical protein